MAYFKLKQLWQSYFIELKLELFELKGETKKYNFKPNLQTQYMY